MDINTSLEIAAKIIGLCAMVICLLGLLYVFVYAFWERLRDKKDEREKRMAENLWYISECRSRQREHIYATNNDKYRKCCDCCCKCRRGAGGYPQK